MDLTKVRLTKGIVPFETVVETFTLLHGARLAGLLAEQGQSPVATVAVGQLRLFGLAVLPLTISKSFIPSFFFAMKVFKDKQRD